MFSRPEVSQRAWIRIVAVSTIWISLLCFLMTRTGVVSINSPMVGLVLVLACIAWCILSTSRTTYLPFLSETVFPPSLIEQHQETKLPTHGVDVTIPVTAGAIRVAWWASDPSANPVESPERAYGKFQNSGVVPVTGKSVKVTLQCPGHYYVKGRLLPQHVHYREIFESGMMGPVKMARVQCK
jgi:hypothetical protein